MTAVTERGCSACCPLMAERPPRGRSARAKVESLRAGGGILARVCPQPLDHHRAPRGRASNEGESPQGLSSPCPHSSCHPHAALRHQTSSLQAERCQAVTWAPRGLPAPGPNCPVLLQWPTHGTRTASFLLFRTALSTPPARAEQKLLDLLTPGWQHR